jgi:enoyl-CoA hydratase/carnithine racemase
LSTEACEIAYERDGRVAIARISRPTKLNALSRSMIDQLQQIFTDLKERQDTGAVVLAGTGRAFAAGADISEYASFDGRQFGDYQTACGDLCTAIETNRQPVIAAVGGLALGGGFELVLACDIVVAGPSASFALPEVNLALLPGWGGTQRLTRLIGRNRAKHLMLTGEPLPAHEAAGMGIVTHLVSDGDETEAATALAHKIASKAPLATAAIKQVVNTTADAPLADGLAHERQALLNLFSSRDGKEGINAFIEKRPANFNGT